MLCLFQAGASKKERAAVDSVFFKYGLLISKFYAMFNLYKIMCVMGFHTYQFLRIPE